MRLNARSAGHTIIGTACRYGVPMFPKNRSPLPLILGQAADSETHKRCLRTIYDYVNYRRVEGETPIFYVKRKEILE